MIIKSDFKPNKLIVRVFKSFKALLYAFWIGARDYRNIASLINYTLRRRSLKAR